MMQGSNLTGGDCLWTKYPQATGPVAGTHYLFVSNAEVDRLLTIGMNCFRLVFSWECVQPASWAAPDALPAGNYKVYWDRYKALVDYITSKGATCVIDIHGGADSTFGAYRGVKIGQNTPGGTPVEDMFENLYWHLGRIFASNPKVQWGLTNEPVGMPVSTWFRAAQKAISALRKSGARQMVWAPGCFFSGASSWVTSGNAAAWNLTDSANALGVQVHMYMDPDRGGGSPDIVSETIGVDSLKVVLDWARPKGIKVLVGEVGMSAAHPLAAKTWENLLTYMRANADVLAGWCWWSTGPKSWWGNYQYTLCDTDKGRANLALIRGAFVKEIIVEELQAKVASLTEALNRALVDIANRTSERDAANAALLRSQDELATVMTDRGRLQRIVDAVREAVKS